MSVHRIHCPECGYELMYATMGSRGSYRTDGSFAVSCARASEIRPEDAMSCPVLRAEAERVLRIKFPERDVPEIQE